MNDKVATETRDTPPAVMGHKLVAMIRDHGCRTSSGPAEKNPHTKAAHMTAADRAVQNAKYRLPKGAVHI